jgi:hypothetical protein
MEYAFTFVIAFGLGYVAARTEPLWSPTIKRLYEEARDAVRRKLGRKS